MNQRVGSGNARAHRRDPDPVALIRTGSAHYRRLAGLTANPPPGVPDPTLGERIAAAYLAGPAFAPEALAAYRAFRAETIGQFEFLTRPVRRGGLGVTVRICHQDPYPDARAMADDLREHHRLSVYATAGSGNEHPLLPNDENDMFRAVHDAFGHACAGRAFDADGEEEAWREHLAMYSPLAGQALTTETRGQTCALIYHYRGHRFATQKVMLLPPALRDPRRRPLPPPRPEDQDAQ